MVFSSSAVWEFEGGYDPTTFFRSLTLLGDELILYIECSSIDTHILRRLDSYISPKTRLIEKGTLWPKGTQLHLRLTEDLVNELIEISENYAVPEYADHVVIYGDGIVLEAYDFTRSPFCIDLKIPEKTIDKFANMANIKYKRID